MTLCNQACPLIARCYGVHRENGLLYISMCCFWLLVLDRYEGSVLDVLKEKIDSDPILPKTQHMQWAIEKALLCKEPLDSFLLFPYLFDWIGYFKPTCF